MLHRRWKWIEDSDGWTAFVTWQDALPRAHRVELAAGLEMLLDYGPEHDTYQVGDELYVVYACSKRTVLWLLVGVARPGERWLLPLAWGTGSPSARRLSEAADEATEQLRKWRSGA